MSALSWLFSKLSLYLNRNQGFLQFTVTWLTDLHISSMMDAHCTVGHKAVQILVETQEDILNFEGDAFFSKLSTEIKRWIEREGDVILSTTAVISGRIQRKRVSCFGLVKPWI